MRGPGVLMVTGAYYPETTGGGLQCRQLVLALRDRATFSVLTTTADAVSREDVVDGIRVVRIAVTIGRIRATLAGALRVGRAFLGLRRRFQVVHLHGFSRKTILLIALARLWRRPIVLKLTSIGHDDPQAIEKKGRISAWAYGKADLYICVSPRQEALCRAAGLPPAKVRLIPNGVDTERFRPADDGERAALRRALGLPPSEPIVLFVGFFSAEKQPHAAFEAWRKVPGRSHLVYVGATAGRYYEIDPGLAPRIRAEAAQAGVADRIHWVETTTEIERYVRAADVFVMPSSREGLPNALLEAMGAGLACIASRLPGVTDTIIEHGMNGVLVDPGDAASWTGALARLLGDPDYGQRLGERARKTIQERFSIERTAADVYEAYRAVTAWP